MFPIGALIIYGANGVCKVMDITEQKDRDSDRMKRYYVLEPLYKRGSTIFTPIDNDKVIMRPILEEKEARALIERITELPTIEITEEKNREQCYKDTMKTYATEDLARVVKTVYLRKLMRVAMGKKVLSTDDLYLRKAGDLLYGEVAASLSVPKERVGEYIEKQVRDLR